MLLLVADIWYIGAISSISIIIFAMVVSRRDISRDDEEQKFSFRRTWVP